MGGSPRRMGLSRATKSSEKTEGTFWKCTGALASTDDKDLEEVLDSGVQSMATVQGALEAVESKHEAPMQCYLCRCKNDIKLKHHGHTFEAILSVPAFVASATLHKVQSKTDCANATIGDLRHVLVLHKNFPNIPADIVVADKQSWEGAIHNTFCGACAKGTLEKKHFIRWLEQASFCHEADRSNLVCFSVKEMIQACFHDLHFCICRTSNSSRDSCD